MQGIKLAVAIPTYNSSECLHELLSNIYETLDVYGYDIYIYDSSTNDQTELLIGKEWKRDSIYYVRLDSSIASNQKVYYLYRQLAGKKKYDYIWMTRDAHYFSRQFLEKLFRSIQPEYDVVLIDDNADVSGTVSEIISDRLEFFRVATYKMTLYGSTIVKCESILGEVDWGGLTERYLNSDCINFSHVALYLEQIKKRNPFCALRLIVPAKERIFSRFKKDSFWKSEVIRIWSQCWLCMLENLPVFYQKDTEIFNQVAGLPSERYSLYLLLSYRINGTFDYEKFMAYKEWLLRVSNVTEDEMARIARMEPEEAQQCLNDKIYRELSEFAGRFGTIVIYGAGRHAQRHAAYLDRFHIPYECFVVSRAGNKTMLDHHKIKEYSDIKNRKDLGIILGLGKANQKEVMPQLLKDGFDGRTCYIDIPLEG